MKKILGILGITLIMAVSFFNMSSVADVNQNVNLASIIQNASADPENCSDYETKEESTSKKTWTIYDGGKQYTVEQTTEKVDCWGWGSIPCEPGVFPGEVMLVA